MPLNTNQQWFPNTGIGVLTTANANLDGTGAIVPLLTAGQDGTMVNSISIKAQMPVSQGMIRLFIKSGVGTFNLFKEITVSPTSQSSALPAFGLTMKGGFYMAAGYILGASTANSETFSVTVDAVDIKNCACG